MSRVFALLRRISLLALALVCLPRPAGAAGLFDPALRFRQLQTEHFVIYFHQGEDALAVRLSHIAEDTWEALRLPFGHAPPRTYVVLADQTETSNGFATPLPYNTIVITAAWPAGSEFIGNTDDWLKLVFTHEFTHIVHLDRSRSWARVVKGVFGRVPLAFPNLFLPTWEIEGLATYFESTVTGGGRLYAQDFRAIEQQSVQRGRTFPLDRANGGLIGWPAGYAPYAFGVGFHEYLAEHYGSDRFAALADRSAGRIPYIASKAFKTVYGASLGDLWADYQRSLLAAGTPAPSVESARQLTHDGFVKVGPRFAPSCAVCPGEVVYSTLNADEFPSLKALTISTGSERTLATRYLGSTVAIASDRIIFDQQELRRNAGLYADLFALDRRTGDVRQLTTEARLLDPDLSPDGKTLAAVREGGGARALVMLSVGPDGQLGPVVPILSEPETQFSTPRWSPDGRSLVAERHRLGEQAVVVVIDAATRTSRVVATGATRAATPVWRPDGGAIVAAVDSETHPFELFEFRWGPDGVSRRQLTHTAGGATWPALSPDGATLVFVGYTDSGYELFMQPYPSEGPVDTSQPAPPAPADRILTAEPSDVSAPRAQSYAPWSTLWPRAWTPLLVTDEDQWQAGASTGGSDVLRYHVYAASLLWRLRGPDAIGVPSQTQADWSLWYAYDRWRPRWFASASRSTSFYTGASAIEGRSSTLDEQTVEAGVFLPFRRVRRSQRLLVSGLGSRSTISRTSGDDVFRRVAGRGAWAINTAHVYGYSISPEGGISGGVTAEVAGRNAGEMGDATTVTADLRAYVPGVAAHQVLAVRLAGGTSSGPRDQGRTFRLGGATSNADVMDFSRGAMSLLRGFAPDTFAGRQVAVMNLDYRLPLARVERGVGTWPAFLRTLHAAAFVDVANAWTGEFAWGDLKTSVGAEVSTDVVIGYALPFTITGGVARGHDGSHSVGDATTAYVRIGRAF